MFLYQRSTSFFLSPFFFLIYVVQTLFQNEALTSERDELVGKLNSSEQLVKQREGEMVHIHQQYQLLYQQFANLQIHYASLEQRLQVHQFTRVVQLIPCTV